VLESEQGSAVDRELRRLWDDGRYDELVTEILKHYGPELFGYLVALARTEADATDAFSLLSEDLWRGIPSFRWNASVRTWSYVLARNALRRTVRPAHRRAGWIPLSEAPEVYEIAEHVRTRTCEYLRTEVKDEIAELRRTLEPDDQHLLVLRVGRKMHWNDIARVMSEAHDAEGDELAREAARLRKRFERAKRTLARLAHERGLTSG
jgi:RNA polymerase sigma-70 factor, ECF subfamily